MSLLYLFGGEISLLLYDAIFVFKVCVTYFGIAVVKFVDQSWSHVDFGYCIQGSLLVVCRSVKLVPVCEGWLYESVISYFFLIPVILILFQVSEVDTVVCFILLFSWVLCKSSCFSSGFRSVGSC